MTKYIHKDLVTFIKSDVKKIKLINSNLKNSNIANSLSTYFGWKHFNELQKNINKDNILNDKTLYNISEMKKDELQIFKNNYTIFINESFFNISKNNKIDPFNINSGLFHKIKNKIKIIEYLQEVKGAPTLELSLFNDLTQITLTNENIELIHNIEKRFLIIIFIDELILCNDSIEGIKWSTEEHINEFLQSNKKQKYDNMNYQTRTECYFMSRLNSLKEEIEKNKYDEIFKLFKNFNFINLIKNNIEKDATIKMCKLYTDMSNISESEMFPKTINNIFLSKKDNTKIISLDEIINFKGNVRLTKWENYDNSASLLRHLFFIKQGKRAVSRKHVILYIED
jgi:hypothetical protein